DNEYGDVVLKALVNDGGRPGELFMPMHWSEQFASRCGSNALVAPLTDPFSAQPDNKASLVDLQVLDETLITWRGFVVTREAVRLPDMTYACKIRCENGYRLELAGTEAQWLAFEG